MGKVIVSIEISNNKDILKAEEKIIAESAIRKAVLENVLGDTGATTLCLPKKYIEQLGLPLSREVVVSTATGEYVTNIYSNAFLSVKGGSTIIEVIELHDNASPLLGVIPMEILGLEVDVVKHELRLLPDHSKDTYLLAY
ncbi:MAG: aspartyl protease family protein [Bacteroidota bacterium]